MRADLVIEALARKGVMGGLAYSRLAPGQMEDVALVCATEMNTDEDIEAYAKALREVLA
jgi:glycine dehydrogenase subunit 1